MSDLRDFMADCGAGFCTCDENAMPTFQMSFL